MKLREHLFTLMFGANRREPVGSTRYVPNARYKRCLAFMRVPGSTRRMAGRRAKKKDQKRSSLVHHQGMASQLPFTINRSAKVTLAEQIRRGITEAIDKGLLVPGARLPSWRDLAAQLVVA